MNVTKPEKIAISKKGKIIYIAIIIICITALLVAFYVQFYKRIDLGRMFGINTELKYLNKTEEETIELESQFLQIFNNEIYNKEIENSKKIDSNKDLVYEQYENEDKKSNCYDLEVHIPKINIQNEVIEKYNKEIEDVFLNFVDKITKSENRNIIYTVDYTANVQNGILSVMIRSNFKEGTKAQKIIIKTYNYDLRNNKELKLEEVLKFEQLDENKVQSMIDSKIEIEQKKAKSFQDLGYNIYSRDINDEMYKIENTEEFYMTDNVIYIIYPYGNTAETSEMDLVIL